MISPNKQITYNSPFTLAGLPKDAPVLLAFSGGADSSALLHLLLSDAKQNGYPLFAAHFNHKIEAPFTRIDSWTEAHCHFIDNRQHRIEETRERRVKAYEKSLAALK